LFRFSGYLLQRAPQLGRCRRGASLPDPNHVLEGEGKTMRHVKFRCERDLERPFVRRYIRAAMDQAEPTMVRNPNRKKRSP
jgi:hypothetical protein